MKPESTSVDPGVTNVIRPLYDIEVRPGDVLEAPTEQEYGIRNPRKLLDPKLPTRQEAGEHCLTHLP